MAGTKTTAFLSTQGVTITKDEDFLTITNQGQIVSQFDVSLPGLHLRVHEAVRESFEGSEGIKTDPPYTPLPSQLKALGVADDNIPASLMAKMKMMRELSTESAITTADHGDMFNGITRNAAGEVYVRFQSSDPNELCDLAEEYPEGQDTEENGEVLFVYGNYKGAAAGYCPPIPKGAFLVAGTDEAGPRAPEGAAGGIPNDDGAEPGPWAQGEYPDLGREVLTAEESRARTFLNTWFEGQKFGDRFQINTGGEFEIPGVMHMFATQRFAVQTGFANPSVFKYARAPLSQCLLDTCESNGGQISALRVVAICFKKSKLCGKPDWPLFLKFLGAVVPQCLNYIGGRFVSKDGFNFGFEEDETEGDFDF
jgi:hypothetical protein